MPAACAIAESVRVIGTKPRLLIVRYLDRGERGFNELKEACGLSSRTLSLNLSFLARKGLVASRRERNRVLYCLSPSGAELMPILKAMGAWGKRWRIFDRAGRKLH